METAIILVVLVLLVLFVLLAGKSTEEDEPATNRMVRKLEEIVETPQEEKEEEEMPKEKKVEVSPVDKRRVYHVVPAGKESKSKWKITQEGVEKAVGFANTKVVAVDTAKKLAKRAALGQVIVHKQDGKIQTEYTYGKDPKSSRG